MTKAYASAHVAITIAVPVSIHRMALLYQRIEAEAFLVYFEAVLPVSSLMGGKQIARSSNGRTTDSESVYLGSNPSLAASDF